MRLVLGDREMHSGPKIERHRLHLGRLVTERAPLLQWRSRDALADEQGHTGLMHLKVAVLIRVLHFFSQNNGFGYDVGLKIPLTLLPALRRRRE